MTQWRNGAFLTKTMALLWNGSKKRDKPLRAACMPKRGGSDNLNKPTKTKPKKGTDTVTVTDSGFSKAPLLELK